MSDVAVAEVEYGETGSEGPGTELYKKALEKGDLSDPDFALVFSSSKFDIDRMVNDLSNKLRGVPWMGCTTAGELSSEGSGTASAVILLLESEEMDFEVESEEQLYETPKETGKKLGHKLSDDEFIETNQDKIMMLLNTSDVIRITGSESKFLDGINDVIGSESPIVGGVAADDYTFKGAKVFTQNSVIEDGVVGATIITDNEIRLDQKSSWDEEIATGVVSETGEKGEAEIQKINGQKAAKWYADKIGIPKRRLRYPAQVGNLYQTTKTFLPLLPRFAKLKMQGHSPSIIRKALDYSRTYPLADDFTPGEYRKRLPISVTSKGGLKLLRSPVYENMKINVLKGTSKACVNCADQMFEDTKDSETIFGFIADCGSRWRMMNKEQRKAENKLLQKNMNGPFIGFYTYGELGGKDKNNCNFKNQTITGFKIIQK
ncbi:MAG: FIST signal transduction protein [Candidatus Nanohaloarchaea archaeon]